MTHIFSVTYLKTLMMIWMSTISVSFLISEMSVAVLVDGVSSEAQDTGVRRPENYIKLQ